MAAIPLEDNFTDILQKAQRGLKLTDESLAARAGISAADLIRVKNGAPDEALLCKLAPVLNLGADTLLASANQAWYPAAIDLGGLAQFNTTYQDMTVNSYLLWDENTKEAVAFDTGATCEPMLEFARSRGLAIKLILLTHTHPDHIADLAKLKQETTAPVFVSQREQLEGASPFQPGFDLQVSRLKIQTRQTSGHSVGGITYFVKGLEQPVAVVGDAIFAGSMGGGAISYADALANNRSQIFTLPGDTILCPGHGPLTTVAEQKAHNPFYPEFQITDARATNLQGKERSI